MTNGLRKSGIATVGDIPWGTHFCHFYENKEDLLDVLVPYFKTGLEQNEVCVWEVFDPLTEQEAESALESALPGVHARFAAGDIEIVSQSQWRQGDGALDFRQLIREWEVKLEKALARGCAGMRVSVNGAWLAKRDRRDLDGYEDEFSRLIAERRIVMLCAYRLAAGRAAEILEQVVETPELDRARAEVKRLAAALRVSREHALCYFELGLVGMAIVSPTEGCLEVNNRLCEILGYPRSELMQMSWAALVHPDDLAVDIRNYGRISAGEVDGYRIEKRWIRRNGDVVHTNSSLKCQRHEDGSVDYFAAMVEERTLLDLSGAGGPPAAGDTGIDPQVLSGREREVARLIGLGKTVKEIAGTLALSEKTVSTYRARILTKLNLNSTAALIRYTLQNGLTR